MLCSLSEFSRQNFGRITNQMFILISSNVFKNVLGISLVKSNQKIRLGWHTIYQNCRMSTVILSRVVDISARVSWGDLELTFRYRVTCLPCIHNGREFQISAWKKPRTVRITIFAYYDRIISVLNHSALAACGCSSTTRVWKIMRSYSYNNLVFAPAAVGIIQKRNLDSETCPA